MLQITLTECTVNAAMQVRQIIPPTLKTDLDKEYGRIYQHSHYQRPDVIDVLENNWFHMTRLRFNGVRAVSPLPKAKPVLWDGDLGNNFYKDFSETFPDKPEGWMPVESDFERLPTHDSRDTSDTVICEGSTCDKRVGHYLFSSKPLYKGVKK